MSMTDWIARRGWLRHNVYHYSGFAGVPGRSVCLRCGQPWASLGIPLDNGPCRGNEYYVRMSRRYVQQRLTRECYDFSAWPLRVVRKKGEREDD